MFSIKIAKINTSEFKAIIPKEVGYRYSDEVIYNTFPVPVDYSSLEPYA